MVEATETHITIEQDKYQFVDAIPEIAAARLDKRLYAQGVLERRRLDLDGAESLPLPIDALSSARKVIETADVFGEDSPEHQERYDGLLLDCKRLVAEWRRKNTSEYFPTVRHVFDKTHQEFFSHGWSIRQMTENGLSPQPKNPEEEARRVNEYVEDATPLHVRRFLGGAAIASLVSIRTISECSDEAIRAYKNDILTKRPHQGYSGYVPEIEKIMIRDITLDAATDDRFEEQVGVSGLYITHDIIQEALRRKGVDASNMSKTELHGAQFLATDNILGFVALLDQVASEQWCTEVFMGEEVSKGSLKDYESFKKEALARQAQQEEVTTSVANFVLDLAEDETIDPKTAPALVEDWVRILLLSEAKEDLSSVEQMFDENTAKGLREVIHLESIGEYEAANLRFNEVKESAPGGGFCGAGSCGLEGVARQSEAEEKGHKLGLKGDLIKDNVRTCPHCHRASIVYDKAANKACLSCGLRRIGGKTSSMDIRKLKKAEAKTSSKNTPESHTVSESTKRPAVV